jgi:hypothetical protein
MCIATRHRALCRLWGDSGFSLARLMGITVQVEYPLFEMLKDRSVSDFRLFFQI